MSDFIMQWRNLLSSKRFHLDGNGKWVEKPPKPIDSKDEPSSRSEFLVDHDRVVFSSAFRRLGRKTQVHPLAQNDHTHNRLTHSVEVASVGRSLGNLVGIELKKKKELPDEINPFDIGTIVQVACLAHDIGNPPFGHAGEDALRDWFCKTENSRWLGGLSEIEQKDIKTYEGNAHGLRRLATIEIYTDNGGMRLTSAVIGTLIKYPWTSEHAGDAGKFNIYQTELTYFECIAKELGLIKNANKNIWVRHPLSYLMEAADDICYAILDLEDAVEIGMLDFDEVNPLFSSLLSQEDIAKDRHKQKSSETHKQCCARLRGLAINNCIINVAQTFIINRSDLMSGEFAGRHKDLLSACDQTILGAIKNAKQLADEKVYRHRTNVITKLASFSCLGLLLDILIPAVHTKIMDKDKLSARNKLALELLNDAAQLNDSDCLSDCLYDSYMKVLDYIGGMTDNMAAELARKLSGFSIL